MQFRQVVDALAKGASVTLSSVVDGFDAIAVADLARGLARSGEGRSVVLAHVSRDGARQARMEAALGFVAPDLETLSFPGWDCQPYDRVSPNAGVSAARMTALARLARTRSGERPRILLTSVDAMLQRVIPRRRMEAQTFSAKAGDAVDTDRVTAWLEANGFLRTGTVRDVGEYAVRGGIIDLYAGSMAQPVRLDFFGDTLETIRAFDPESQRSTERMPALDLVPMSEVTLTSEAISRFRQGYINAFGAVTRGDPLYEAVSEGRRTPGVEHWLPLFQDGMDSLLAYLDDAPIVLDALAEDAAGERLAQVTDYFQSRRSALEQGLAGGAPYKPLTPSSLLSLIHI